MSIAKLLDTYKIIQKLKWGETKHIKIYGLVLIIVQQDETQSSLFIIL